MAYSHIEQSNDTGLWYIRPITRGFPQPLSRREADQIAGALNQAYDAGREAVRSELRDLIGAASQETDG